MRISLFPGIWALLILSSAAGCGRATRASEQSGSQLAKPEPAAAASSNQTGDPAADPRPVIVAFGDSLTAGFGVQESESYPALLERRLISSGYNYRIVNAGISGDTTGGGLSRLDATLALKPRIVILELGANDGLRGLPVETTRANLEHMIEKIQQSGAKVLLAGMTLPPNYGADYVRSFEQIFTDLSKKYHTALIPFLLEGVAAHPRLMQDDGLHPTVAGQKIVAENVRRALEPLLPPPKGASR